MAGGSQPAPVICFSLAMSEAVWVEDLVKAYGDVLAVDRLSFSVERGEIFGLLGPNGAGKTTTLEIIEGLQTADSGRVSVLGLDAATEAHDIKARTGVQLQSSSYYEYLTLREILSLLGSFYPRRLSPEELLRQVGLEGMAARRVRQLSGGEQQRFALAASLVNDPDLVILDEPTTGLDPVSRRDLWTLVRQVRDRGATVIVTTHYMEEAEEHCDRVAIINRGRLQASGAPHRLISQIKASWAVKLVTATPLNENQRLALGHLAESAPIVDDNTCLLRLNNDPAELKGLLDEVGRDGIVLEQLEITPVTLEDVFIELTQD